MDTNNKQKFENYKKYKNTKNYAILCVGNKY